MKTKFRTPFWSSLAALTLAWSATSSAASLTWDTANANNNWNATDANWTGGAVFTSGDGVAFTSATGETVTVAAGGVAPASTTISNNGSWTFSGGSITAGTLSKAGTGALVLTASNGFGAISVSGGAIRIQNSGALGTGLVSHTGGQVRFSFGNGTNTTVGNAFSLNSSAHQTFIVRGTDDAAPTSATTVRLTGQISGGNAAATYRLGDSGTGQNHNNVLILDNAGNNFQGTIEMWRGTLAITSNGALGNLDNDIIHYTENTSGSLRFDADNIILPATRSLSMPGTAIRPINTQGYTSTIEGVISGGGNFAKQGTGTLILTNSNTYTGATTISAGTLAIRQISSVSPAAITFNGTGSLRFSFGDGSTTTFPNNHVLHTASQTPFVIRGTAEAAPTLSTTVRLTGTISGGASGQAYTLAQTDVSGNHNNIIIFDNPANTFSGQIVMDRGTLAITSNGALGNANNGIRINTWNLNGSLRFDADAITLPSTRAIALADGTNLSPINTQAFTSTIEGVISGTGQLVKQGVGTLILTGANTNTGATNIAEGTLEIGGSGRLGAAAHNGAVTINGTLRFNSSASQTLGGVISGTGSLVKNGSGAIISNGNNTYTGATTVNAGSLLLNGSNASSVQVASGAAFGGTGSTTGSLTLADGSSYLVGTGLFTASGGVSIGGPVTVQFSTAPAPGTYPILNYGAGGLTGSVSNLSSTSGRAAFADDPENTSIVLTVATGTRTWAVTDGTWDSGVATNFAEDDHKFFSGDTAVFPTRPASSTVTLDGNLVPTAVIANHTSDYVFSGTGFLSGNMTLTKQGAGSLTIGTPNTYTGDTVIEDGTLVAANTTALGSGLVALEGGTLNLGGQTLANAISSNGGALAGPGTVSGTLSASVVIGSGTVGLTGTVGAGTVAINSGATFSVGTGGTTGNPGAAPITIASGGMLQVNRSNALTLANTIDGDGSLIQAGSAALTLTGSNSHTGGTTIASSSLTVNSPTALGTGPVGLLPAAASGTGGGVFTLYFANTAAVACGNAITLPEPATATTYTIMKQSSGQTTGTLLDLTGPISGGNANSVLRLNSNTTGDRSTTYRLAWTNTLAGDIELFRGSIIITGNQSLGTARLLLNANNNTTDGDVRFENPATLSNDIVLYNTANVDPIHTGGHTISLTGTISGITGGFGLTKIGAGTLALSGATTFAADTRVEAGTLALSGSATLGSSPNIYLSPGATFDISAIQATYALPVSSTLRGGGSVAGTFTAQGTISPGAAANTVGTLTFGDSVTLDGGTVRIDFDSRDAQCDQTIITGDLVAGSSGAFTVADLAGVAEVALPPGTKLALVKYTGSVTGLLDINGTPDVADGATVTIGLNSFILDYDDITDGVNPGKFITLTIPAASGYSTWAAANAGGGAADADADGDGVPNGVEYFMGQTGNTFTANPPVLGNHVTWPKDNTVTDASYIVQVSADLQTWTTAPVGDVNDSGTSVIYTLPGGPGPRFVRLSVTVTP